MIDANRFPGKTDSETIENALAHLDADRILVLDKGKIAEMGTGRC